MFDKRLNNAYVKMKEAGADAILVPPSDDLFYLTGYSGVATERVSLLILSAFPCIVIPSFEAKEIQNVIPGSIDILAWEETQDVFQIVTGYLKNLGPHIMVSAQMKSGWLLKLMNSLSEKMWTDADQLLASLRSIKDPAEQECLKTAQGMAEEAMKNLIKIQLVGKTEKEIVRQLNRIREEIGFDSFGAPLIASGVNSSFPHHKPADRVVAANDVVLLDFGGCYKGYHADITRTLATGRGIDGFADIYQIVLRAHLDAERAIRPGVSCESIDKAGRKVIENAGYGKYFTHRLGHGIGISAHEKPFIATGEKTLIETGNVFSNEPGIYLPNKFGVRIENMVCVTEDGSQSFNVLTRELQYI